MRIPSLYVEEPCIGENASASAEQGPLQLSKGIKAITFSMKKNVSKSKFKIYVESVEDQTSELIYEEKMSLTGKKIISGLNKLSETLEDGHPTGNGEEDFEAVRVGLAKYGGKSIKIKFEYEESKPNNSKLIIKDIAII